MNLSEEKIRSYLFFIVFILSLLGLLMVYSSSYLFAKEKFGTELYFFIKQGIFLLGGLFIFFLVSRSRFFFWTEKWMFFHFLLIFLIILTLIPSLSSQVKGARRWISLSYFSFQPSEFLKFFIVFPCFYLFEKYRDLKKKEIVFLLISILLPLVSFLAQPDFGSFSISVFVIFYLAFLGNFPKKIFYGIIGGGGIIFTILALSKPYRIQRLLSFLDPWKDPQNSGFQIIQSFLAFANGSFLGMGPGNSNEKLFYLPEAHNDFILSVIGEELGFIGVFLVILLFLAFVILGHLLALKASNRTSSILMLAFIFIIGIQGFLNMGVVLGLLPTKGLNLPFVSYGGSSMLANFVGLGFILSASKYAKYVEYDQII